MESTTLEPVAPCRPPAAWIGGKRLLAPNIVERIASIAHAAYAEPFIGMGGVFFRRPFRARAEFINDVNGELVTLFRILQRHHVEFFQMIRWRLSSRAEFERLAKSDPTTLADLERAARFLYLQRLAFGGKVAGQNFGISPLESSGFDITRIESQMADLHDRLAGVTIECLPYAAFIERYDRPAVLFYLDPPYFGSEGDYGAGVFSAADFARLAEQLAGIAGKFLLSINDAPEIRRVFAAFRIEEVTTKYSVAGGEHTSAVTELLITNTDEPVPRLL